MLKTKTLLIIWRYAVNVVGWCKSVAEAWFMGLTAMKVLFDTGQSKRARMSFNPAKDTIPMVSGKYPTQNHGFALSWTAINGGKAPSLWPR